MSETAGEFDWGSREDVPAWMPGGDTAAPDEGQPAEAQSEPAADTSATESAATGTDRPRDEQGRFTTAAPAEETADDPEIQGILAKYGGDPNKALKALAESQSYIGQLHQTQGEMRAQLEELTQAVRTPRPQQDFESMLSENPKAALEYALVAGDVQAYNRAKEEWNTLAPGAADVYEQNLRLQGEMQQIRQQLEATAAPVRDQQTRALLGQVFTQIQAEFPDFDQLRPQMEKVVADLQSSGYDPITPAIESGDPQRASAALRQLALSARGLAQADTLQAAQQAGIAHAEAAERAKQEAIVASATSSVSGEERPLTPGEKIAQSWAKFDRSALRDS